MRQEALMLGCILGEMTVAMLPSGQQATSLHANRSWSEQQNHHLICPRIHFKRLKNLGTLLFTLPNI